MPKYLHETNDAGIDGLGRYWGWHIPMRNGFTRHYRASPRSLQSTEVVPGLGLIDSLGGMSLSACIRGLHASARLADALLYAGTSNIVSRVVLSGQIDCMEDKAAALERTVVGVLERRKTLGVFYRFLEWMPTYRFPWEEEDAVLTADFRSFASEAPKRRYANQISVARRLISNAYNRLRFSWPSAGTYQARLEYSDTWQSDARAKLESLAFEALGWDREDELLGFGYADRMPSGEIRYRKAV